MSICRKFQLDLGKEIDMRINATGYFCREKSLEIHLYDGWCGP